MQYETKTHTKYTQTNTNKSMHSEMTQCDKPNPENCKNCACKCAYDNPIRSTPPCSQ